MFYLYSALTLGTQGNLQKGPQTSQEKGRHPSTHTMETRQKVPINSSSQKRFNLALLICITSSKAEECKESAHRTDKGKNLL